MLSVLVVAVLALPAASVGHAGGDAGDHRAGAGHAADGHVVGRAAAGHHRRGCARRAAQGHVAGGKVGHRLAEDHREVDRRGVGRVSLADGLVDRHRRRRDVVGDRVVGAGGGRVGVAGRVVGHAGGMLAITVPCRSCR